MSILLTAAVLIMAAWLLVSIPMDRSLPGVLEGTWEATGEVFADFKAGEYPDAPHPDDFIAVRLTIEGDGGVHGTVGEALLLNGTLRRNRNKLGRLIGVKSDFIVEKARIEGRINSHDPVKERLVVIPLNLEEGLLKGSIQIKAPFRYPDSLFPRLHLKPASD